MMSKIENFSQDETKKWKELNKKKIIPEFP